MLNYGRILHLLFWTKISLALNLFILIWIVEEVWWSKRRARFRQLNAGPQLFVNKKYSKHEKGKDKNSQKKALISMKNYKKNHLGKILTILTNVSWNQFSTSFQKEMISRNFSPFFFRFWSWTITQWEHFRPGPSILPASSMCRRFTWGIVASMTSTQPHWLV